MSSDEITVSLPGANTTLSYDLGESTSVGGRSYNEDFICKWESPDWACFVVADGAGGHGGGDVAARIAGEFIVAAFRANPTLDGAQLERWVAQANDAIVQRQAEGGALANMHTTVVAAFICRTKSQIRWVHVGDSRLYLFRDGQLLFRTRDHSTVQALIDAGSLPTHATRTHARRNELYAALGEPTDTLPIVASEFALRLWPGDFILLCSDGLWEHIEDDNLYLMYAGWQGDLNGLLAAMTDQILQETTAKRPDNLSAFALRIH